MTVAFAARFQPSQGLQAITSQKMGPQTLSASRRSVKILTFRTSISR